MSMDRIARNRLAEVGRRRANAEAGGQERMARQQNEGKFCARERIDLLQDAGTFEVMDRLLRRRGTGLAQRILRRVVLLARGSYLSIDLYKHTLIFCSL